MGVFNWGSQNLLICGLSIDKDSIRVGQVIFRKKESLQYVLSTTIFEITLSLPCKDYALN